MLILLPSISKGSQIRSKTHLHPLMALDTAIENHCALRMPDRKKREWRCEALCKTKVFASGGHGSIDLLAEDVVTLVLWEIKLIETSMGAW